MVEVINQVSISEIRHTFELAVQSCRRDFPSGHSWSVSIREPESGAEYMLEISKEGDVIWRRSFFGPTEVSAGFIRDSIREALRNSKFSH